MKGSTYGILALCICHVSTFNLEPRIPIIKKGAEGSYFGYSVAEHQEVADTVKSWILVGAPLDKNLQPGTNKSGALWKCDMSTTTSCEQVITDGRRKADEDESEKSNPTIDGTDLYPPKSTEIKDGQWLGVTLHSQGKGGKVLVCAHRHIVEHRSWLWGKGLCYILKQNLEYQDVKDLCWTKPQITKNIKNTTMSSSVFFFCQSGTSGMLTSEDDIVIGLPGYRNWEGLVKVTTAVNQITNEPTIFGDSKNQTILDLTLYEGFMSDGEDVSSWYSNLGMSVTAGNYFHNNLSYAVGAPRSKHTGQVFLFNRYEKTEKMEIAMVLNGEQLGSGFGYQVASADLNGDKRADVIVSAPFYFDKSEGGAVYIYNVHKCKKDGLSGKKCKPVKLYGRQQESRFGFAIANISDINKDGYEDIAIGAPYEGRGTVYIYLGSPDGIITTPSQVIRSEDTPMPVRTFGYSLSGGLDMDNNKYPDLLVGAYEDAAVFLLRARKIIDISTYIRQNGIIVNKTEPIDSNKFGCAGDRDSNLTCITFEACCKVESSERDDVKDLKLKYFIEAETYSGSKKFSRVWFSKSGAKQNYVSRTVTLLMHRPEHCQTETVYLKDNTRDIQSPIKFRFNYTLIQDEPKMAREGEQLPDINRYPILNQQKAAQIFEATFQKDCGNDDLCESDLKLEARLDLPVSSSSPGLYELLLGEREEVIVDISVTNEGESAYEAQLFVTHSASLNYIASKSNDSVTCNLFNKSIVSCSIGNPFKKNNTMNVQVRFDPKGLEDDDSQLKFTVFTNSTSKQPENQLPINLKAYVLKKAELSINGTSKSQHGYFGGRIIGESAMKHLNDIGPRVFHTYEIYNAGPWKVSTVDVIISWPYEVANDKAHGKWLLYLEETPMVQGGGECQLPPGHVANPLKLSGNMGLDDPFAVPTPAPYILMNQTSNFRRRRDTEKVVNSKTYIEDGRKRQVVSMNCKSRTAKCFDITCTIYDLQQKKDVIIVLKSRLWNSTLAEDYPRVDKVIIASNARIIIPSKVVIQQENTKDDFAIVETVVLPDLQDQQEAEPVPIWIIIVAVLAGLLLLVLLTLLLWKLGFFKRRRPDQTLSGNLQKHRDDNLDNSQENEALFKN